MNIHPTALVESGAEIGEDVEIGPYARVGPNIRIGPRCHVGQGCYLDGHTRLGENNILYPYVSLGTPPQDLKYHGEPTELVIGDDNVFREFVTVNRGTVTGRGITNIGNRNLLMINSHVAHDCVLEDDVVLVNGVLMGGHSKVESGAKVMGAVGITPFATVGRLAFITGSSGVGRDMPPYMLCEGRNARVRQVNEVGLRRAGFSDETIAELFQAYKKIFRTTELNRMRIFDQIEAEGSACEDVLYLVRFMRRSLQGRHGRYLESLRKA